MRIFSKIRFAASIVASAAALLLGAGTASAEAPGECVDVNGRNIECPDSSGTHQNTPIVFTPLTQAEVDALMRLYTPPVVVAPPAPPVDEPSDGPGENSDTGTDASEPAPPVEAPSEVPTDTPSEAPVVDGNPASFDVGSLDAGFADPGAVSSF